MLSHLIIYVLHNRHLSFALSEYIFADYGRENAVKMRN